jgi:osmoprotectant transport system ATP-binding protein
VARALAAEPPVLLMDEPFGAVDPIVRERLQNEFLRLHRTQKTTVLFVTHDIDEAIKLGDRVAVMRAGALVQYAPPGELLAKPADEFVAQFVGADRGLKLLGLLTVGGADVDAAVDRSSLPQNAPVIDSSATLREALGRILASASGSAAVVDDDGGYIGALSLERISAMLRQGYRP